MGCYGSVKPQRTFEGSRRRTTRDVFGRPVRLGDSRRGRDGFHESGSGLIRAGITPRGGRARRDQSEILDPLRMGAGPRARDRILKGLILAQNERWRRGLGMQVGRAARPVA